ncbi:unnamed protein product [Polarella glacialis]|uniref:Uncharacterized protein n=1 Tax=Polarella glacialis TaxID=89957 RepID=A0A813L684_POLGL|nr:unnamed protein product [Polarella glacialis]
MCVYFMILTPAVKHVDQGSMMNFRSWNKRGWCRAERAARFLSTVNTSMILIESPTRLEFSIPLETLWCPVGLGDFTVDADKKKVGHLMRLLLTNKLEALLAAGKFHDYRILLNLQSNLLKNLPIQPVTDTLPSLQKDSTNNNNMQPSSVPSISESVGTRRRTAGIDQRSASTPSVWASRKSGLDALMLSSLSLHNNNDNNNTNNNSDLVLREDEQSATVQQFLYQNGFTSIHERDEVGWTPTCFAALNGDHDLIRDLLASRANVNDCLSMTHPLLVLFNKGMFVLSLCAMFSNNAALKLLIAEKADVDASDCKGRVPLVSAGTGGNPEGIKILIASGSNPYHKNILGNGPMVHACVQGCHESVAAFLEAGVPVSGDHGTPLLHYAVAVPGADPILVKRLLEARADIDEPFEVRSLIFSMAFSIASCRYRLGSRDKFNSIGYHGISSTPLIFSVAAGSFALAQYLVDAGARLDCRNSRGKTAWDLAKELDAPSSLIMELEISNVEP